MPTPLKHQCGMLQPFLCQGLCVLPIASSFHFIVGFSLNPSSPISFFNTGPAPRAAEARVNGLHHCFSRAGDELRAGDCFAPAHTYDGLFPSLLHLAPVPAPALTLLAVLTPGKRGRGGQPWGEPSEKASNIKKKLRDIGSAAAGGQALWITGSQGEMETLERTLENPF